LQEDNHHKENKDMKTIVLTADAARRFDEAGIEPCRFAWLVRCIDARTGEEWLELRSPDFDQEPYGDLGTSGDVREIGAGLGRVDTIRRQADGTIVVTWRREPLRPVFVYRGQPLPPEAMIMSGGGAQDYGASPWGSYVAVNPDGTVDVHGDNLPDRHAFENCYCDPPCEWEWDRYSTLEAVSCRLPAAHPDGSPLEEGDSCTLVVHGNSGSYPEDYVFQDGRWKETYSGVPWQLR
jgi:hypothetical protein